LNTNINFVPLGPELIITSVAILVLMLDITLKNKYRNIIGWVSVAGLASALVYGITYFGLRGNFIVNQLTIDDLSVYARLSIVAIALTIALVAMRNTYTIRQNQGEFYALMLFSVVGTMVMASASNLVTIYVGIELSTIPMFILVAFRKARAKAGEALIKFFILGIMSSAFLLYGLSLVYGLTAELDLTKIATALGQGMSPALAVASLLIIAGFGFKLTAVPFHFWAPDTYEGAPVIVVSYIATVSKIGAFVIVTRVFVEALQSTAVNWPLWFGALAVITMTLGNLMALPQTKIKRMMAYSGIAHAGYLLVGLAVGTNFAISSMFFFLIAYAVATAGVFFVVAARSEKGEADAISSYTGLSQTNPALALVMAVFLFSLIGIPPLGGFFGKYYLAASAIGNGQAYLGILIFINSVISLGYYVKIIRAMYLQEPESAEHRATATAQTSVALGLTSIAIIYLGIIQNPVLNMAHKIFSNIKL